MIYSQEYKKNTDQNLCTEKPRNSYSNSDWNASHKGSPSFSTAESSPNTGRYVSLLQFQSSTDNIPLFTTYTTITVFSHV